MQLPLTHPVSDTLRVPLETAISHARHRDRRALFHVTLPVPFMDPITFFARARAVTDTRLYWSPPGEALTLVGIGTLHRLVGSGPDRFRQIDREWQRLLADYEDDSISPAAGAGSSTTQGPKPPVAGPLLLGGFSFEPRDEARQEGERRNDYGSRRQAAPATPWHRYPDGLMILPRYLVAFTDEGSWLSVNLWLDPEQEIEPLIDQIEHDFATLFAEGSAEEETGPAASTAGPASHSVDLTYQESEAEAAAWQNEVRELTEEIRRGRVDKVVLARELRLRAPAPFSPERALRSLQAEFSNCYVFAISEGDHCFLGASPEQLVRVQGERIETASLAGSIARGAALAEDDALGQSLLHSPKDRREHELVVRGIREALAGTCDRLELPDEPVLMKLPNVQHLYTPVKGVRRPETSLLDVVKRLHPTPAMGGFPRDRALREIRRRENFDRGWYAAPIGWLDHRGDGEFAVGIRSALLRGDEASLYAGCGIVADSDPEVEYQEAGLKFRPMWSALSRAVERP